MYELKNRGLRSDFVGFKTVQEVPEDGSGIFLVLPEAEDKVVFLVPVIGAVDGEVLELSQHLLGEGLEALLESGLFLLSLDFGDDLLAVLLEPALEHVLVHAGLLILE